MKQTLLVSCLFGLLLCMPMPAQTSVDPREEHDLKLARAGVLLTEAEAIDFERRIDSFSSHRDVHLTLAWFWLREARLRPRPEAIEARRRHFLWLLNGGPKDPLFRRAEIPRQFGEGAAADKDGLGQFAAVWERHLTRSTDDKDLLLAAAGWLQYSRPERAFDLYQRAGNSSVFANFCARVLAGCFQADTRDGLPDTELTRKVQAVVDNSKDLEFLASVMRMLNMFGSRRYFANEIAFDYTGPLKKHLPRLAKEKKYAEEFPSRYSAEFPPQRHTFPERIRVGGNVMASKMLKKVDPAYPILAQRNGVQGTVRLMVVIEKDGTMRDVQVVSGPVELKDAALNAVKQWEYLPTHLNDEPLEVVTVIDVNFSLRSPEGVRP